MRTEHYSDAIAEVDATFHLPRYDTEEEYQAEQMRLKAKESQIYSPFPCIRIVTPYYVEVPGGKDVGETHLLVKYIQEDQEFAFVAYRSRTEFREGKSPVAVREFYPCGTAYVGTLKTKVANSGAFISEYAIHHFLMLLGMLKVESNRYVVRDTPRAVRRQQGLKVGHRDYVVVPRRERARYSPGDLLTRAKIMRQMHWVRGFFRTYRHERYVKMRGAQQKIEPHRRGQLGSPAQIKDYHAFTKRQPERNT